MRILVVEPDRGQRQLLVERLLASGHDAYWIDPEDVLLDERPYVLFFGVDSASGDWKESCRSLMASEPELVLVLVCGDRGRAAEAERAGIGPVLLSPFGEVGIQEVIAAATLARLKRSLSRITARLKSIAPDGS